MIVHAVCVVRSAAEVRILLVFITMSHYLENIALNQTYLQKVMYVE